MPTAQTTPLNRQLKITGMTCAACATRLEKVLNKKDAVKQASVNFATETAMLELTSPVDDDELYAWVAKAGFGAQVLIDKVPITDMTQKPPYRLILLWLLSLPFWVGMLGMMVGKHTLMVPVWVQFVIASIVQIVFGWTFYKGAWASLRGGLANMDVLVALGTTAIWLYSTYIWWTYDGHGYHMLDVYFEASVMVIAFVSLGKYLETRTKTGSLNSLAILMNYLPKTALRQSGEVWEEVAVADIRVGDVLQARTGDRIAVDGIIIQGSGYTDDAHLTGESITAPKYVDDVVLAGALVDDGSFYYQASKLATDTAFSDMMAALAEAQGSRAHIARLADVVSGIFVPVVVALALLSFIINYYLLGQFDVALMRAVAVLVIACPCALGLATPAAIMAGMGVAARHGVYFKDAVSLEKSGALTTMVFDKTGTLTTGQPSVVALWMADGIDSDRFLAVTHALESHAKHPLAQALQSYTSSHAQTMTLSDFSSVIGSGVQAHIAGVGVVKIGTPGFVGFNTDDLPSDTIWRQSSLVAVAIDDVVQGIYALGDTLRADSIIMIQKLQADGVDVMIMSGDRQSVVDSVAEKLGVSDAHGAMSPRDKANKIKELQNTQRIAMVGDGVNDAPAMAAAYIGMAVADASDVARHTAQVQLVGSAITHAYYAHTIARHTLTTIRQNLFFAFIYNTLGIPLAMMGLLSPMWAALAMALSSISVLGNALRLKWVKFDTA